MIIITMHVMSFQYIFTTKLFAQSLENYNAAAQTKTRYNQQRFDLQSTERDLMTD